MSEENVLITENHLKIERKVIHLMLTSRSSTEELINSGISKDFFANEYQFLVQCIFQEHLSSESKRVLTRGSYQQYIIDKNKSKELYALLKVYDLCYIGTDAEINDLGFLKKQLLEIYVGRNVCEGLQQYQVDSKKAGWLFAARNLVDKMQNVLVSTEKEHTIFSTISDLQKEFIDQLEHESLHPESIIRCGIPEIDSAINVGFRPGHLTLIVADVGGHKTNLMINLAINLSERGFPVLFVPLEMPWRDLVGRLVSNRSGVNGTLLAHPETMGPEDWKKVKSCQVWSNKNFAVLEGGERLSMSRLRREIEKRISVFTPRIVVIDYADIMQTDVRYESKTIEIGEMLHSLRTVGKRMGFHIISAAQMNRSAIRALRDGNDDAMDSTSIHGSHNFGAVSDTIFGLQNVKGQSDRIKIHRIKARHGPKGEAQELRVDPARFLISSTDPTQMLLNQADFEVDVNRPPDEIASGLNDMHNKETKTVVEFQSCDLDDLDAPSSQENKDSDDPDNW